jgi:PEP-CTERM motif-containing protein
MLKTAIATLTIFLVALCANAAEASSIATRQFVVNTTSIGGGIQGFAHNAALPLRTKAFVGVSLDASSRLAPETASIPEPALLILFGTGLAVAARQIRKRQV